MLIILTGMSGAGKSVALNALEDIGYHCTDNLPIILLETFVKEFVIPSKKNVAVSIDSRNMINASELINQIIDIKQKCEAKILFLTSSDEVLVQRFSETRRNHPLYEKSLISAIQVEKQLLSQMHNLADILIDTSQYSVANLRHKISELFKFSDVNMLVSVQSFGFKYGIPINADFLFDARFLPNPYWETNLRAYTGNQQPIIQWFEEQKTPLEFVNSIYDFLEKCLQKFDDMQNQRAYITICIGCTGGQHRSVYVAENLAVKLAQKYTVSLEHRDMKVLKSL